MAVISHRREDHAGRRRRGLDLFVPPEAQGQVRHALKDLLNVPVQFESLQARQ